MTDVMKVLRETRSGRLVDELNQKLGDLIAGVSDTGKVGSLKLTLKLKPRPNTDGSQIELEDAVVVSIPERSKPTSLFFADGQRLLTEDPHQRKIEGLELVETEQRKERAE